MGGFFIRNSEEKRLAGVILKSKIKGFITKLLNCHTPDSTDSNLIWYLLFLILLSGGVG